MTTFASSSSDRTGAQDRSEVFRITPGKGEKALVVPYWALPFDELLATTFGGMSPTNEPVVRDMVQDMKRAAAEGLANPPPSEAITADSPVPFSIRQLWFDLDNFERRTFKTENGQRVATKPEQ